MKALALLLLVVLSLSGCAKAAGREGSTDNSEVPSSAPSGADLTTATPEVTPSTAGTAPVPLPSP